MRRVIVWVVVIFVILGGVPAGNRSAAQDDGSQLWMVVSHFDETTHMTRLQLKDPLTGLTQDLDWASVQRYLRAGNIQHDLFTDVELQCFSLGVEGPLPPDDYAVAGLLAASVTKDFYPFAARPSPDWQWVVIVNYRDNGSGPHIYSVNLDSGEVHDLLDGLDLSYHQNCFGVAFSPDQTSVFVNAFDMAGEEAIYRLRLDGNNPSDLEPAIEYNYIPLQWVGDDRLLAQNWDRNVMMGFVLQDDLSYRAEDFTRSGEADIQYVGYDPSDDLVVLGFFDQYRDPFQSLVAMRSFEIDWGLLGWQPILTTPDQQWVIVVNGHKIGRVRMDGSLFEVVSEVPNEGRFIASTNGQWVASISTDSVYRVNMATGDVSFMGTLDPDQFARFTDYSLSPDGQWLIYWLYNHETYGLDTFALTANGDHIKLDSNFITWMVLE